MAIKNKKRISTKYVKELKRGSAEAFTYIFDFYKDQIYYFCFSFVHNQSDAEDIVQETFIRVLEGINSLHDLDAFHSWLFKICYYTNMQHFRKNKNVVLLDEELNIEVLSVDKESEDVFDKNEILNCVKEEIDALSTKFKTTAQLRYLDDLSVKEIADVLELPEGTIKSRLKTSREALQEGLKKRGVKPSLYFGFTFFPFMAKMYQQLFEQYEVQLSISEKLQQSFINLTSTSQVAGAGVASVSFVAYKAIAITGLVGAGFGGVYLYNSSQDFLIKQVEYYSQPVRTGVEIRVETSADAKVEDIVIKTKGKDVEFSFSDEELRFVADTNGEYLLRIKDEERVVLIDNIDKVAPVLNDIEKKDGTIKLIISDDYSGIDYRKSYLDCDGQKYAISKNGEVNGKIESDAKLYLYDNVSNSSEYSIQMKVLEE